MGRVRGLLDWLVRSPWRSFLLLFLLTFLLYLNELRHIPDYALIPDARRELGAIAISLAQTGRFADPYAIPTGATAHLPPVYPFMVSLIYRWLGLTAAAGTATLSLIALTTACLYAMLPWVAGELGLTRQAGFLGGVAAAFLAREWHGHGEYLTGIALALMMLAFLKRWTKPGVTWYGSLLLGLGIGAAFHLQPALLPVALGCMAFELWWNRSRGVRAWLGLCALGILLACAPWAWRNYTTFQAWFFIRSNLGLELRMGNHEGAAATIELMDAQPRSHYRHPTLFPGEASKLRDTGEATYMRQAQKDAVDWIGDNPGEFLKLTAQRFANLWGGPLNRPAAARGVLALTILAVVGLVLSFPALALPQRLILIIPLVTYPAVYYFVAYMPRYRVPIDWLLFTLAGAVAWSVLRIEVRRAK